jgi:hypothetical protein
MKLVPIIAIERYKIEICFINLIILSYLFRTAIPLLKFPFLLLYSCFIVYSLWNFRRDLVSKLREFVRNYYLLLFLAFILVISFLFSNKLYLTIFKDVVNLIILLSIFFISTLVVREKSELNFYVLNLIYLIVLFSFFISILALLDYFDIYSFIDYSKDVITSGNASRDPIALDYNFALLPIFFGIVSIFYLLLKNNSKLKIIYFNILLLLFSLDIILSGSRRGIITFLVILFTLMIAQIYAFYKKNTLFGRLGSNSKYFLLSIFFLSILSFYVALKTDYSFKVKLLEFIGSKNLSNTKEKIASKVFKYSSIFGKKHSYQEFYSTIWPTIPEDPDSGWGTRVHKTIFPLTGKNVEIVPNHAKGYMMDSTCNASYYSEIDLCEAYTLLADLRARNGDEYRASVYCFASEEYDSDIVYFGVGTSAINKKIVTGNVSSSYDLNHKGIWQKLEIDFTCTDGEVPILVSFWKRGVKNFSKLKGYVIFAYPIYEKINKEDNSLPSTLSSGKCTSFISTSSVKNVELNNNRPLIFLNKKNQVYNPIMNLQYYSSGFFYSPFPFISALAVVQKDLDPLRNLALNFISEDTTYYPYKAKIVLDTISNSFIGDRVLRWEFALKIFSNEYNWKQKIFGGGFNFLNWFGYYFDRDKTRSDYPHNPFLSVLLYSGIIGLIFYLILMYKVFYYYVKYFKEHKILSIFFIITFYFSFFSAGSPFDPPIMGFFVILPFFIHSIHKKIKPEQFDNHVG